MFFTKQKYKLFFFCFALTALASCSMLDTEPVSKPAYLYVPSMQFTTANFSGVEYIGDSTHKFLDVWISNNGKLLGTIGMPALFPVKDLTGNIDLDAGISRSGQIGQRVKYPFTETISVPFTSVAGKTDTIRPVFKYASNVSFPLIEDFDRPGFAFSIKDKSLSTDTVLPINDDRALKKGSNSGMVSMDQNTTLFGIISTKQFFFRGLNSPAYLELDYKTNLNLQIALYAQLPGTTFAVGVPVIQLFPTQGWNKVYIDLTQETAARDPLTQYQLYIGVVNFDKKQAEVYLDNIKLVRFK